MILAVVASSPPGSLRVPGSCGRASPRPAAAPASPGAGTRAAAPHVSPLHHQWCDPAHLAGDVSVAGHVAVARVHDVAVDLLVQRGERRDVGVRLAVDHGHLKVYCFKWCTSKHLNKWHPFNTLTCELNQWALCLLLCSPEASLNQFVGDQNHKVL